jgi:beta-lactamase regulating signal transducer with metallopeptidase domain
MSPTPFAPADVQALGWSLLHFLWQGAALALVLASLNVMLRRAAPAVRYRLAALTLLLMVLLPAVTFWRARMTAGVGAERQPHALGATAGPASLADPLPAGRVSPLDARLGRRIEPLLPFLVALWGAGVVLVSLRSIGGWAVAQRFRRTGLTSAAPAIEELALQLARRLRVSAPVRLCQSALVQVPTVIGALRPMILLPACAVTGLSTEQLELILAHELAHVRRADYLVNLLQTAAETLLFYHPGVWWVSHRMRLERELCCDDLAIAACGNPAGYARALAELEELRPDQPAFAMAASGGSLLARIARLAGAPEPQTPRGLASLLAAGALTAALGTVSFLFAAPAAAPAATEPTPAAHAAPEASPAPRPRAAAQPRPEPRAATPAPEARAFPLPRILELAQAGVTPEYVDEMSSLGYPTLSVDQLLALRSQGVGPEFVRGLGAEGFAKLTPDQLISLRSQGVSPQFVHGLKAQGLENLSLSDLIDLRSQGVDPEFVEGMKRAGYASLSVQQLVTLRSQGIGSEYVTELKALGYTELALMRLIALRSNGVTPQYIREMAELGHKQLEIPMLIGLRSHGVTPDFVRGLKELGYSDLAAGMLIELRDHGVTPDFVRELRDAGFERLTAGELIQLRDSGVRGELLKRLKGRVQESEGRR